LFDMFTVGLLAAIVCGLGCLVIVFVWLRDRSTAAYAWWIIAFLLYGLGVLIAAQRYRLPLLSNIGTPGFATLLGFGAFWSGLRILDRRPTTLLALTPAMIWAFGLPFVHDAFALRQINYNVAIGTGTFLVGFDLWRSSVKEFSPRLGIAIICLSETVVSYSQAIALVVMRNDVGDGPLQGWFTFAPFQSAVAMVAIVVLGILMIGERTQHRFRDLAMKDELTGIFNRRGFFETSTNALRRTNRKTGETAMALFDIDFFKSINDTYGHPAGDRVIAEFAQRAARAIRPGDILGRIGGEEFALLLPGTTLSDARKVVERVRAAFADTPIVDGHNRILATTSAGISTVANQEVDLNSLVSSADEALLAAKKAGRNRTSILRPIDVSGSFPQ